jgi:hypothetical protein
MSILNEVRGWWASRRQRQRDAFIKNRSYATPEGAGKLKRSRLKTLATRGMPEGTGISPTGTPMDFTADEEPPRY